jgi:poly(A) polymerase
MRLEVDWLSDPAVTKVVRALETGGVRAWFVGGCVRDGLLGVAAGDIDIATDAPPDRVKALAEDAGLRAVPTGEEHGTITIVADGIAVEVTTLRRDVETDGRRATVAFTDRLEEDAHRRDFTMNALYAMPDGTVLDPTGEGRADLQARRVRFIGTPGDRIREDYLRILRFFRFHAWYADPELGMDAEGLAASAELADGLVRLAKERIGAEMKKLLTARDPAPAVAAMAHAGVLQRVLPGAEDRFLGVLVDLEGEVPPDPIRRLAILGGEDVFDALRLSRAEAQTLTRMRKEMAGTAGPGELGFRHGEELGRDILLLRAALAGHPVEPGHWALLKSGANAEFPLKAADLMPGFSGPALGAELLRLEQVWIDSGFAMTRDELLR